MTHKPTISKSLPHRPLTHRFPVYHKSNFIGYLRLTGQEKGQLTRGHALYHRIGESDKLRGLHWEKALKLLDSQDLFGTTLPPVGIYLLSDETTATGKPKLNLYTRTPLPNLPWSQRLLLKDEIREKEL